MAKWYVATGDKEAGPFTPADLRQMAADGRLTPESLLRKEDSTKRHAARQVKGLFPDATASTPQPAASPEVPAPPPAAAVPTPPVPAAQPAVAPDSIAIDVAASPAPAAGRAGGGQARWVLVAAVLGVGLVGAAAGFAGASLTGGGNGGSGGGAGGGSGDVASPPERVATPEEMTEEAKKELEELQESADELKKENRELEKQRDELKSELDNLISLRDELKRWQGVDVVFVTPRQFALGLSNRADRTVAVDLKASGPKTEKVVRAAVNARIPVVASAHDVTRRLHNKVSAGELVPKALDDDVSTFYGSHNMLPVERDDECQWVTFWDVNQNRRQFGLFQDVTHSDLSFVSFDGKQRTVARGDILPGSAFKGGYDEVIPVLDERHFLDYCLLRVAQQLQSSGGERTAHTLGVHVCVDEIDRFLSEQIQDPQRPQLLQPGQSVEATGLLAWGVFAVGVGDFLHRMAEYKDRLADARSRRSALEELETAAAYLEDEVYSKLNHLGVVTYEREYLEEIAAAQEMSIAQGASLSDYGRDALLTHALIVDVKPPKFHGNYHVAVRLVDLLSGTDVFAANGDRIEESLTRPVGNRHRQYHLDSGRLAVVETPATPRALEEPLLVARPDRKGTIKEQLVYVEQDPLSSGLMYRPLFGKERFTLGNLASGEPRYVSHPQHVPQDDLFRYVVCRTLQKCLPPAGRVIKANGRTAQVSIGRASGIARGDTLRALRYFDDGYTQLEFEQADGAAEHRLPVRLNVTEVYDHHCTVVAGRTGFEEVWYDEFELKTGDMVIPTRIPPIALGFTPPVWGGVGGTDDFKRDLRRNPGKFQRLARTTHDVSVRFGNEVQDALKDLGVRTKVLARPFNPEGVDARKSRSMTVPQKQIEGLRNAGATHAVVGEIQLSSARSFQVRLAVLPLFANDQTYDLTDTVDFTLREFQLPE